MPLGRLDTPMVREWRALLLSNGVSHTMAAKAYRLLRAVLMTAVTEDKILAANPCRVRGADAESPAERPTITEVQVLELADLMPERYRALVLLKTFANRRRGEIIALQRMDVDADLATVRVRQQYIERRGAGPDLGPPKSRAGARTVASPKAIGPVIQAHLDAFVGPEPNALVFPGPTGVPVRMGHDSPAAALVYQHASRSADPAIADALSARLSAARKGAESPATARAEDADTDG